MDNVLDLDHIPLTQEDVNLFNEEKKFMCSIFLLHYKMTEVKKL